MPHINFKNCSNALLGVLFCICVFFGTTLTTSAASQDGFFSSYNDGYSGTANDGSTPGGSNVVGRQSSSGNCDSAKELCNPLRFKSFAQFFSGLLHIIVIFAIPIIILMIIYSGFMYVMARGSEEQVTKATRSLTYAVLGGLIILGAELILRVIQGTVSQLTI